jgi:hypothetical protein
LEEEARVLVEAEVLKALASEAEAQLMAQLPAEAVALEVDRVAAAVEVDWPVQLQIL